MKTFKVTIEFMGLTGKYFSEVEVRAKNAKSAEKKALLTAGNRDVMSVSVKEVA